MIKLKYALLLSDLIGLLLSFSLGSYYLSFSLEGGSVKFISQWSVLFCAVSVLITFRFAFLGHYAKRQPVLDELHQMYRVLLLLYSVLGVSLYLIHIPSYRIPFLVTAICSLISLPLGRLLIKSTLLKNQELLLPTIIVGSGSNAIAASKALKGESLMGFQIVEFISIFPIEEKFIIIGDEKIPVVFVGNKVIEHIKKRDCNNVVVALELGQINENLELLEVLNREVRSVSVVPALRGLPLLGMEVNHFFRHELLFLRIRKNLSRPVLKMVKRVFDIFFSVLFLTMFSPLFVFFNWRIKKDGASSFFSHTRIGQNGKEFPCYKFRTMVADADKILEELLRSDPKAKKEWETDFKLKNDPRITPIGHFLRKTSLDELPQLFNVLKGDMSLVGPRPVVKDELARYGDDVHYYLQAKPGMTGLWQISGRNDTTYASRVYLDSWYVKNWSLWYDIVILIKTVNVVFCRNGAY